MTGWWALAFVVLWLLVVVLCIVVIALARRSAPCTCGSARGAPSRSTTRDPPSANRSPRSRRVADGEAVVLGGAGRPRLVLFASATCAVCREVSPGVPAAAAAGRLEPIVVHDVEAEQVLDVPGTPFVVVLDERGIVRAKGTVNNLEQVEGLVDTANRRISEDREQWAS